MEVVSSGQLAQHYDPLKDSPYMNPRHLDYFKEVLEDWRAKVQDECREMEDQLHELRTGTECDEIDKAAVETEVAFTVSRITAYTDLIHDIDTSLDDITNGKYGFCKKTGKEIGLNRLLAQPTSKLSVVAQRENETEDTPVAKKDNEYSISLFEDA